MGFNKIYLPSVEDLKERLKEDKNGTIRWLQKADALIGQNDSIKFAEDIKKMKAR